MSEPATTSANDELDDQLDAISRRCLLAVIDGGETWQRFKADAELETGLPWMQIKDLLGERHANRLQASL